MQRRNAVAGNEPDMRDDIVSPTEGLTVASLTGPELAGPLPAPHLVRVASNIRTLRLRNPGARPNEAIPSTPDGRRAVDEVHVKHEPNWVGRLGTAVGAILLIVVALIVISLLIADPKYMDKLPPAEPVAGLTIFAVFFVGALAIERILEPIASSLDITPIKDAAVEEVSSAKTEMKSLEGTVKDEIPRKQESAKERAETAVVAVQKVSDWTFYRTVIFWSVATVIAMWAAAAFHLYFLRTVGIDSGTDRSLEILATGLIIGAGTKPLHDLVGLISATNSSSPTP